MYNGYTLANGKKVAIDKVEIENLAEFETTYNFEVAEFHTYYVGNGVCVHNMNGQNCGRSGRRIPNKEAKQVAQELGYEPTNYTSKNGAKIYKKGNQYISADVTSHNGGYWKVADSPKALNSKTTRKGTFDKLLKKRIGD